jgi:hypothetical protein
MLEALGYTVVWEEANADAEAMEIAVEAADASLVLRGEIFKTLRNILDKPQKDGTEPLGTVLALEGYVAPVVEPETPEAVAATAVTALNLVEIEVKFDQEVDKTSAETAANYTVTGDSAHTVSAVALQADKMSVVITLTTTEELAQQEEFKVNVKDVLLSGSETVKVASTDLTATAFDATVPEIVSIELVGPQDIKITFSEPVVDDTFTVLVNNGMYGVTGTTLVANSKTHTFQLATTLADGDYTVKVSGVKDIANFSAIAKTFTLAYAADTTVPTVSIKSATQQKVVLTFSKDVKNTVTKDHFYHTFSAWKPDSINRDSATQYTLNFTTYTIPAGEMKLNVLFSDGTNKVEDLWGNDLADTVLMETVTADTTKPEVKEVKVVDEDTITVEFTEDVDTTTAQKVANYVLTKTADGKEVTTTFTATLAAKKVTLQFASKLSPASYTLAISGVKDIALTKNTMDGVVEAIEITDKTAPTISSAIFVDDTANEYVYVTFDGVMNADQVVDKANYQWGASFAAKTNLPTDATIALFGDASKVKITLPAGTANPGNIYVAQIADANGNKMAGLLTEQTISADTAPKVTKIKTIALNKLELTVDMELSAIAASDILVRTTGGANVAVASATYANQSNGTSIITVVLNASEVLANEGAVPAIVEINGGGNIKSITGTAMVADADLTAAPAIALVDGTTNVDGVAPKLIATNAITTIDSDADGQIDHIKVTYTELIDNTYLTPDSYTVAGYTVTSIQTDSDDDVTNGLNGTDHTSVYITVTEKTTPDTGATPAVTQALDIYDVPGNKLAAADFEAVTTVDKAAPTLITAQVAAAGFDAVDDTLVLTFSEDIALGDELAATASSLINVNDWLHVDYDGATGDEVFVGAATFDIAISGKVATITLKAAALAEPMVATTTEINLSDLSNIVDTAATANDSVANATVVVVSAQ